MFGDSGRRGYQVQAERLIMQCHVKCNNKVVSLSANHDPNSKPPTRLKPTSNSCGVSCKWIYPGYSKQSSSPYCWLLNSDFFPQAS